MSEPEPVDYVGQIQSHMRRLMAQERGGMKTHTSLKMPLEEGTTNFKLELTDLHILDFLVELGRFSSRSEAFRKGVRDLIERELETITLFYRVQEESK